jgi:hypothetical protein
MLWAVLKFIARFAIIYVVVLIGTAVIWDVLGPTDRDGGRGSAIAIFIAPAISVVGAVAWPMAKSRKA